jgi:hypothetical protein
MFAANEDFEPESIMSVNSAIAELFMVIEQHIEANPKNLAFSLQTRTSDFDPSNSVQADQLRKKTEFLCQTRLGSIRTHCVNGLVIHWDELS